MQLSYKILLDNGISMDKSVELNDGSLLLSIENINSSDSVKFILNAGNCVLKSIFVSNNTNLLNYTHNGIDLGGSIFVFEENPEFIIEAKGKDFKIKLDADVIEDKNSALKSLLNKAIFLKKENERFNIKNTKLSSDINKVTALYFEIKNSFYWRLMAVPRTITKSIKLLVKKVPFLHRFLCVTKYYLTNNSAIKSFSGKEKSEKMTYRISPLRRIKEQKYSFSRNIKFSVLVPLYNTPKKFLLEMIKSVQAQTYKNWELCLADGSDFEHSYVEEICKKIALSDSRIKYEKLENNLGISENTNHCIEMATGEYIALFDHDDLLHPSALFEVMKRICDENADFVYTDENTFVKYPTQRVFTHYKPDFSPDTLRSINYICHLSVFSRKLLDSVGYFNSKFDGSQDYDLILRLTEKADKIVHIPKVLYFWRSHKQSVASSIEAKPYVIESAKSALGEHLVRLGFEGTVEDSTVISTYKINYKIIGNPKISIVIPNKDYIDDLDNCINSILRKTTYENFEIIIVENNSTEPETFEYYKNLSFYNNVKVVYWKGEFNYSAINNFGVKYATGEYVLLLNNDIEIITPDWLEQMLMFAQRSDVGGVGAKLYYPDDTVQHCGVILGIGGVAGHAHKNLPRNFYGYAGRATYAQNLTACTAACFMIRKSIYEAVGGLDEGYKVAFNDVDFCMKIRKAGYLIVFTPYAEMYHYESKSRGVEDTPEKVARFNSEVKRFMDKWGKELEKGDPYYNPNLSLKYEDFRFK